MTRRQDTNVQAVLQWKNSRAATAKASLTATRHTCGRHVIDLNNSRLLVDDSFLTSRVDGVGVRKEFNDTEPILCWTENVVDICIAPVLVCKHVVQTVGGGDNVSAAGLVLQI